MFSVRVTTAGKVRSLSTNLVPSAVNKLYANSNTSTGAVKWQVIPTQTNSNTICSAEQERRQ